MNTIFFLFTEKIYLERLHWIKDCLLEGDGDEIKKNSPKIIIYISGDALYSLQDKRYYDLWRQLLLVENIRILVDGWDIKVLGIQLHEELEGESSKTKFIPFFGETPLAFWKKLIQDSKADNFGDNFGFLEMRGPYISRTSVHCLRALKGAIENDLSPELYGYLDGVHLGHDCQKPSEFENIGENLLEVQYLAKERELRPLMLACSRCGTARGYLRDEEIQAFHQSDDVISSFLFCNLNKIIERFEKNHVILSSTSGLMFNEEINLKGGKSEGKPSMLVLITHSPYGSEWTFGGISFAIASANHGIPTDVVFIEDGVLLLTGEHVLDETEGIFNIQEIIEATSDIEHLNYYAHTPSLELRGMMRPIELEGLNLLEKNELRTLFVKNQNNIATQDLKRIIFF